MKNLLLDSLDDAELRVCFARHSPRPLFPPMNDPAWAGVASNPTILHWREQLRSLAWEQRDEPLPALTESLQTDFAKTGQRLAFERVYFERRRRLGRAMVASLIEPPGAAKDKLLASAVRLLQDVFAERAWALPAHVKALTGIDPMTIDLFGAETANLFAEAIHTFGDALPTPFQDAIRHRLTREFFENYLTGSFWWLSIDNNWNAVCHQGILGAALAVVEDAGLLARLFAAALPRLRMFIDAFGDDGSSNEGPAYWSYGFGWLCELNRQLEARTDGELSLFENSAKIREIAAFGPRLTLGGGYVVNFSDCVARSAPRPSLLDYLARRLDLPFVAEQAAVGWARMLQQPIHLQRERDDFFLLSRLFLAAPARLPECPTPPIGDLLLPDLQVIVSRFTDAGGHYWEFAVKAGHNAEHHNHNDVGSYLLNVDATPLLEEIGAPEYTGTFFNEGRYESLAARSIGHPVPLIAGHEQTAGKLHRGKIVEHTFGPHTMSVTIDLTDAYPPEAACLRCLRRINIDKSAGVFTLVDELQLSQDGVVESPIITSAAAALEGGKLVIRRDSIELQVSPQAGTSFGDIQNRTYPDHDGNPATVNRIVLLTNGIHETAVAGFTLSMATPCPGDSI